MGDASRATVDVATEDVATQGMKTIQKSEREAVLSAGVVELRKAGCVRSAEIERNFNEWLTVCGKHEPSQIAGDPLAFACFGSSYDFFLLRWKGGIAE